MPRLVRRLRKGKRNIRDETVRLRGEEGRQAQDKEREGKGRTEDSEIADQDIGVGSVEEVDDLRAEVGKNEKGTAVKICQSSDRVPASGGNAQKVRQVTHLYTTIKLNPNSGRRVHARIHIERVRALQRGGRACVFVCLCGDCGGGGDRHLSLCK